MRIRRSRERNKNQYYVLEEKEQKELNKQTNREIKQDKIMGKIKGKQCVSSFRLTNYFYKC